MILHIPHSSTLLPDTFRVSEGVSLEKEFQRMTDWYTDELFDCDSAQRLVFPYSRLYCDVERFREDEDEPMAAKGMGVCYTRSSFGEKLREVDAGERSFVTSTLYDPHHQRLTDYVTQELESKSTALIVDCHSFSDEVLPHEESEVRPDICIGTDSFHTPSEFISDVYRFLTDLGYEVVLNQPFAGTIVPLRYYGKDRRVRSIMIEINRKLYLDDAFAKNEYFGRVQHHITKLLKRIEIF